MKFFEKLFGRKKPPKAAVQPIPGYTYWNYRDDLFNPLLSFDDIMARAGGKIPRPPREPKVGEYWEYCGCPKHGTPVYKYPYRMLVIGEAMVKSLMPFVVCGCFVPVEEKKDA